MKPILSASALLMIISFGTFSQDTTFKFIFVPHVRSEDAVNQTVNAGIAKIDFSRYSLKMLGGDLAEQTSKSRTTLQYLDGLFDLKNPNTLWSLGNHDLEQGDSNLIKEFTGKAFFYSYARDGITFLVLNTEAGAEGFNRTFIKPPQLDTVKAVCERITSADTKFFIVLHSRYMWMINNSYFSQTMKDSIAASSKSMDTTNWYSDIEPQLKKVKAKGIPVLVFGGDKSQMNVTYTKDSIRYYAARMENTFTDSVNNCIVLTYVKNKSITCTYVTLVNINKDSPVAIDKPAATKIYHQGIPSFIIRQAPGVRTVEFRPGTDNDRHELVRIYSASGVVVTTIEMSAAVRAIVRFNRAGLYIAQRTSEAPGQAAMFIVR